MITYEVYAKIMEWELIAIEYCPVEAMIIAESFFENGYATRIELV